MTGPTLFLSFDQQQTFLGVMLSASASLAAIAVTLLALIPTLIDVARSRSNDYFTSEAARKKIKKALSRLRHTLLLYGTVMLVTAIGLLVPINGLPGFISTCVVALMFFVATLILIQASYSLTNSTLASL